MPTAIRFITRIQDADDYADALTWAAGATFQGNVSLVSGKYLATDEARAIDGDGLKLYAGGAGIFVEAGGQVGVGTVTPNTLLSVGGPAVQSPVAMVVRNDNTTNYVAGTAIANAHISIENNDGSIAVDDFTSVNLRVGSADAAIAVIYQDTQRSALVFITDNYGGAERMRIDYLGNVGINKISPAAMLHIDQSSITAAKPVLILDQADVSEEMIEFISTIGVGNALEAVGAKTLTVTHFIKATLPGSLTVYIPCGTIA